MDLAQVDLAAQHVILQLHAHACLRITHGNQTASLDTANGVRQGCCLAPSLWVLYTGLILTYIRRQVDMDDSTVFADDFLFHWMIDGVVQLDRALKHIVFVLETLWYVHQPGQVCRPYRPSWLQGWIGAAQTCHPGPAKR